MSMISVIVPVYKMEKYIERCIKSVLSQTYENFELILVDDGSPDRSGELCDALAKTDDRIRVIHKENGGVSSARNAGLDVASGEYVCFCDADDALPEEALHILVCAMQEGNEQLIVGDLTSVFVDAQKNKVRTTKSKTREYGCVSTSDADAMYAFWLSNNMLSSCGKLFLRNVITEHQLRFNTDMVVMEDYAFVIDYVSKCDRLCMIPDSVYTCFSVSGVTIESKRSRQDFFDDVLLASEKLKHFVTALSPRWEEEYQRETIYPSLFIAYGLLWSIETAGKKQRKQKYTRIARAIKNETAQKMFVFYKDRFACLEYYFIKKGHISGILAVHGLRRILKPLL